MLRRVASIFCYCRYEFVRQLYGSPTALCRLIGQVSARLSFAAVADLIGLMQSLRRALHSVLVRNILNDIKFASLPLRQVLLSFAVLLLSAAVSSIY